MLIDVFDECRTWFVTISQENEGNFRKQVCVTGGWQNCVLRKFLILILYRLVFG
jgi:hypothetical protein